MAEKTGLKKEAFLSMAKAFGLDIYDPHIEELYAYVQKILPTLKRIEELNLTDMEPVMPLISSKEWPQWIQQSFVFSVQGNLQGSSKKKRYPL